MIKQIVFSLILVSVGIISGCGGGGDGDSSNVEIPNTGDDGGSVVSNSAPIASAGEDQSVEVGQQVTLSGSQSQDADGDSLSFQWQVISKPASSQITLSTANQESMVFTPDVAGTYSFGLIVNDGTVNSAQATVMVTAEAVNQAPIANAGTDQQVAQGALVTLSGGASEDPEGSALTYQWQFISKPAGSNSTLADAQTVSAKFTADVIGNYEVGLMVNDGELDSVQDSVQITAQGVNTNQAPVANAGNDQTVDTGDVVTLSGAQSSDPDNDDLTYSWSISSKPELSNATLSSTSSLSVQLTPDVAGSYEVSLVVNDGQVNSAVDSVLVTAESNGPIANAGADQSVTVGDFVALNGAQSTGDNLVYQWQFMTKPDNSTAELTGSNTISAEFNADISGIFQLSLVVSEGGNSSTADIIQVTAKNTNIDITDKIFTNQAVSCRNYEGSYFSNVTDIRRAADFSGDVVVSIGGSTCTVSVNAIPNHDFNDGSASFATDASAQNLTYNLPISPSFAASVTSQGIGTTEGILLNGVTIDLLPAACYDVGSEPTGREKIGCGADQNGNPWRYDPMSSLNTFGTDAHNAHTQPSGNYHYHGNPMAMFNQTCGSRPSAVIGFAADGFPIYGGCFKDPSTGNIRKATPSYVLKNNGGARQDVSGYTTPIGGVGAVVSNNYDGQFRGDWEYQAGQGDLDECNGMTIDGNYGYYVTDAFPWVVGCFKGSLDNSFTRPQNLERRSHSHDAHIHVH